MPFNRPVRWLAMLAILIPFLAIEAHAHTLRVIATRGVVEPGRSSTIYLSWGHLLPVDGLVNEQDLDIYSIKAPSGTVSPLKTTERSLQANAVNLEEEGIYQVTAARKMAIFTRYTDAEGNAVHARQSKQELELPPGSTMDLSARSRQFAKAILLCGEPKNGGLAEPLGQDLEIVVETPVEAHGYCLDTPLAVRVLFQGKPLPSATILAASTSKNPDGLPDASFETDSEGRALLDLIEPGTWVLEVHHQIDAPEGSRHQFDTESFTATLTIPVSDHD